jgi:hypothetical protein
MEKVGVSDGITRNSQSKKCGKSISDTHTFPVKRGNALATNTTRKRPRDKQAEDRALETRIADALGNMADFTIAGRTPHALDFNSLQKAEAEFGSVAAFLAEVDEGRLAAIRYFVWLTVDDGEITEEEVGREIPIRSDDMKVFMAKVLKVSGIMAEEDPN